MVRHPDQLVYMLHPPRGLYDAYASFGLPTEVPKAPAAVTELGRPWQRPADDYRLGEICEWVEALRPLAADRPKRCTFPGR